MGIYVIMAITWLRIQQEDFCLSPLHKHMVYVCFAYVGLCVRAIDASGKKMRVFKWHVTVGAGTGRRLPGILSVSETHRSTVVSDLYNGAALPAAATRGPAIAELI